ncbi:MAG: V-type ATPase subunit [Planctomycetota bacterium]|jgi:V/A-type H+-transporting ATPase subunit C
MAEAAEQPVLDFYTYPPIGGDDWRYTFATAQVRVLESQMLTRAALSDMANSEDFDQAVDSLGAGEYALPKGERTFTDVENILKLRRTEARDLFADLMIDEFVVKLIKARDDFANMRLAIRRKLTEKPLGTDYSNDGNVPAELFEEIFEEENYSPLPDYMQEAIERAVLAYYQNKDIRQIDYALDSSQAQYNLRQASRLNSIFLLGLFRIQIDLTNMRTMLRLKFTESEQRNVFLSGGYVEPQRYIHALDVGYEAVAPLFFATPYYEVVESGTTYFVSNKSFLRIEHNCEEYLMGFLNSTLQITAGPQPVIAYLLMKENEIRKVRLILTAKKNNLDTKLILDRIA